MSVYRLLFENLSKLGFSLILSMSLGLILKAYMPRALGVEDIGLFYYADSLSFIFYTFLPLGIHTYINRVIPPKPEMVSEIYKSILVFMTSFSIVIFMLYGLFVYFFTDKGDFLLVMLSVATYQAFFFLTKEILKPIFIAAGEVNFVSTMDVAYKLTQVSLVCGALFLKADLLLAAMLFALSQALAFMVYWIKSWRLGWIKGHFSWRSCFNFISVGLPFFINGALLSFYGNIDITMIEYFGERSEVGWYGSAQQLKGIFMMGVPLLASVIMPLLSKESAQGSERFQRFAAKVFWAMIFLSWTLSVFMASFSYEIVPLLFGSEFVPATKHVVLLAPVIMFTYINVFLSMILSLKTSGKKMVFVTALSLLVNALLNVWLIPWGLTQLGEGGGGIGASITTIIAEILVYLALLKITPIALMSFKNLIVSVTSFVSMGFWLYVLLTGQTTLDFLVRICVFVGSCILIILLILTTERGLLSKLRKR